MALLERRVDNTKPGAAAAIWMLREAGAELLQMEKTTPVKPRKYTQKTSYIFLKHTLAVSELYTYLQTKTNLIKTEFEPLCWRGYRTVFGMNIVLKPDLYAVTADEDYEDHWFFEVDLNTEAPCRIIRKCESYGRYYLSGREQKRLGVFPRVVWIVT